MKGPGRRKEPRRKKLLVNIRRQPYKIRHRNTGVMAMEGLPAALKSEREGFRYSSASKLWKMKISDLQGKVRRLVIIILSPNDRHMWRQYPKKPDRSLQPRRNLLLSRRHSLRIVIFRTRKIFLRERRRGRDSPLHLIRQTDHRFRALQTLHPPRHSRYFRSFHQHYLHKLQPLFSVNWQNPYLTRIPQDTYISS
jgi:hypothetical protein